MTDVIQFEGCFDKMLKDFRNRKFRKVLIDVFKGKNVIVRIEEVNLDDDRSYG
jgi:hypothetical protein